MIEIRNVSAGYDGRRILQNVTLTAPKGKITALIGPNGCGKTTLLRAAARQLALESGEIRLMGRLISDFGRKEYARTAAFLPQARSVPAITVQGLVSHGRFPYLGMSHKMRTEDKEAVNQAMEAVGVADWAQRDLRELSGGERQRVYLAMVFAQGTDIIILDEPTTFLDLNRQFEVLELIKKLNTQGKTIMLVLHDLAHALSYSDTVALMQDGRLLICEEPGAIYESGLIDQVFDVCAHRTADGGYYFTSRHGKGL